VKQETASKSVPTSCVRSSHWVGLVQCVWWTDWRFNRVIVATCSH